MKLTVTEGEVRTAIANWLATKNVNVQPQQLEPIYKHNHPDERDELVGYEVDVVGGHNLPLQASPEATPAVPVTTRRGRR
jgi:hypothetical protein